MQTTGCDNQCSSSSPRYQQQPTSPSPSKSSNSKEQRSLGSCSTTKVYHHTQESSQFSQLQLCLLYLVLVTLISCTGKYFSLHNTILKLFPLNWGKFNDPLIQPFLFLNFPNSKTCSFAELVGKSLDQRSLYPIMVRYKPIVFLVPVHFTAHHTQKYKCMKLT